MNPLRLGLPVGLPFLFSLRLKIACSLMIAVAVGVGVEVTTFVLACAEEVVGWTLPAKSVAML